MALRFGFASLIPLGLTVDTVVDNDGILVVTARSSASTAACPLCGMSSHRVRGHYVTAAERLQHEGFLRREDTVRQILALKETGHSIKQIVRQTRHSRGLVRQAVRGVLGDMFRIRQSSLEAYLPVLLAEWEAGCRNGAELWRRLRNQGFKGCSRVVAEWTARRRRRT